MFNLFKKIKRTLHRLFIPQENNSWKPKYLHHDFLTTVIAVLLIINVSFKFVIKDFPSNILGVSVNISVESLLNHTNAERIKYGLAPLKLNTELTTAAQGKANDIFSKNYWAHYAPDGTSPWYFFQQSHYDYIYAGENLAKDFNDSQAVVQAWMNSEKHRENILKPEYEDIGFAIIEGNLADQPTILVVQLFGKEQVSTLAENPDTTTETAPIQTYQKIKINEPAQQQVAGKKTQIAQEITKKPLINILSLQKQMLFVILAGLIIVLAIDLYLGEKKKVFRLSGKSLIHLMFTLFLILSIITVSSGAIL